jgi:lipoate-protein ligase A
MTDWYDAEEINKIYRDSHSATIKELNDVIVMLRTKVTILEKQLKEQSETAEDKIPASVRRKITHLEDLNKNLKENLKERDNLHVPRYYETEFKKLLKENEKLKEDVEYYKSKVPVQIIINRENKEKPTRKGGIPK